MMIATARISDTTEIVSPLVHVLYFAGVHGSSPETVAPSLLVTQAYGHVVSETDDVLTIRLDLPGDHVAVIGCNRIVARRNGAMFTHEERASIVVTHQRQARLCPVGR